MVRARRRAGLDAAARRLGPEFQENPWRAFFGSICGKLAQAFGEIAPGPGARFVLLPKTACIPVRVTEAPTARPFPEAE
jgi:hypothetical protein